MFYCSGILVKVIVIDMIGSNSEDPLNGNLCPEYEGSEEVTFWCSQMPIKIGLELNRFFMDKGTDTIFAGIVFESYLDVNAIIGKEKFCASSEPNTCSLLTVGSTSEEISEVVLDGANQWFLDHENDMLIISLPNSNTYNVDPNLSNVYGDPNAKKTVGLVYPWALRQLYHKG